MKARVVKLAEYIQERTLENRGQTPTLHGPNGFEVPFTVENYRKVRDEVVKKLGLQTTKRPTDRSESNN